MVKRTLLGLGGLLLLSACSQDAKPAPALSTAAAPTELFFSEYLEGSGNNKALEIYNGTGAAVDLSGGGYAVDFYFNGSASASTKISLEGTVCAKRRVRFGRQRRGRACSRRCRSDEFGQLF